MIRFCKSICIWNCVGFFAHRVVFFVYRGFTPRNKILQVCSSYPNSWMSRFEFWIFFLGHNFIVFYMQDEDECYIHHRSSSVHNCFFDSHLFVRCIGGWRFSEVEVAGVGMRVLESGERPTEKEGWEGREGSRG